MVVDFVAHQDIECVYPMSGQYGRAPRALYYFLLIFISFIRKENWLTLGAAASCLTYGGSAAIHSLILASFLSLGRSSSPSIQDGGEPVLLPNSSVIAITAPILATDLDSDATLAIVGTGFLIVVPLALWSTEFKHAAASPILVLWTLLMAIGMISSMIILYSVDGSSSGPLKQYRFCSPGYEDTLPLSGHPVPVMKGSWNDTIWNYFDGEERGKGNGNNTSRVGCIYLCLSTTQLLRHPDALTVVEFLDLQPSDPLYWGMNVVAAIIYGCVPLSLSICVCILILQLRGHDLQWHFDSAQDEDETPPRRRNRLKNFTIGAINIYGKVLSPFVFVVFLVWVEWIIAYDQQAESMEEVGQWAPLVGVVLAFIAAVVGKYWPKLSRALKRRRKGSRHGEELQSLVGVDEELPQGAWGVAGAAYVQVHTT